MKKGFTIVELAIVLVVIGIILGMAVKGKALVDAAIMKAEVAKLNKLEAAMSIYYAKHNERLPTDSIIGDSRHITDGYIYHEIFLNEGLLTTADLQDKISSAHWPQGVSWGFFLCASTVNDDEPPLYGWYNPRFSQSSGRGMCVAGIPTNTPSNGIPANLLPTDIRLICNIEAIKDDENANNGIGRALSGQANGTFYNINERFTHGFTDCNDYVGDDNRFAGSANYAWLVF